MVCAMGSTRERIVGGGPAAVGRYAVGLDRHVGGGDRRVVLRAPPRRSPRAPDPASPAPRLVRGRPRGTRRGYRNNGSADRRSRRAPCAQRIEEPAATRSKEGVDDRAPRRALGRRLRPPMRARLSTCGGALRPPPKRGSAGRRRPRLRSLRLGAPASNERTLTWRPAIARSSCVAAVYGRERGLACGVPRPLAPCSPRRR